MNFTGEWVFTVPCYTLGTWNTRNRRTIFMDCSGVDDLNWAWWGYSCSQWQNWPVNVQLSSFGFSLLENSSPLREMSSVNKLITQLWDQWSFLGRFEGHSFTRLYKNKVDSWWLCCVLTSCQGSLCCLGMLFSSQNSSKCNSKHNKVAKASASGRKHPTFLVYLSLLMCAAALCACTLLTLVLGHRDVVGGGKGRQWQAWVAEGWGEQAGFFQQQHS